MLKSYFSIAFLALVAVAGTPAASSGQHCPLDLYRPACGKVCKLVCEPKKLASVGYGSECKQICIPGRSEPGCEHCTCCCGERKCDPCACCQPAAPLFKFCWRDWCPCCCGQPRSVKVLTKYQLTRKVRWYHWEVVDANCCGCAHMIGDATSDDGTVGSADEPAIIKPAVENAKIGDSAPISNEERAKLAALFKLDESEVLDAPLVASTTTDVRSR
ncbi:MAG TPA: hypothetical protein VH107_07160 [Lacipirellulaceae bacterium]|nr:hypothetical protein [Lacipirellulaceae bacterium]